MAKKERFEVRKPNKDDHKGIKEAADGVKQGLGALGLVMALVPTVKKYGPKLLNLITKK